MFEGQTLTSTRGFSTNNCFPGICMDTSLYFDTERPNVYVVVKTQVFQTLQLLNSIISV